MEALVRWRHPLRGELQPTAFVDAAERHGLGQALTRWALDAAVGQVAAWCADGTYLPVSVNVSARRVSDPTFADDVEDALARHDVPPHLLEIELTETASPPDLGAARIVLQRLHRLGIGIAIDGFGTGHASLAYLEALPVDVVKIDGSFVARLARRPGDDAIVRTILALGHSLGLQVVAEGVHDDRVARRLAELGCELGQGFRWTRPLPPSDALAWARASAASARRWHDVGGTAA
jgi:EAL domain-containing protein (putative c-di-GMP-specific phosphodiesterase class I)